MTTYRVVLTCESSQGADYLRRMLYNGKLPAVSINVQEVTRVNLEHPGRKWIGSECSLDGFPATVVGRMEPFATIRSLDYASTPTSVRGKAVEFAWETVDRIMTEKGGEFHS